MHQERAIDWAEDAFNSLSNSYQPLDAFDPIVLSFNREPTPSLVIDSSPRDTASLESPITPPNSRHADIIEHSNRLPTANMIESPMQPLRKSSRRVSRNRSQIAEPEDCSAYARKHPQTTNTRKNRMGKKKRGRPTTHRADKDEDHYNFKKSIVPSTGSRETYLEKNRRAAQRCRERKKGEQEELCKKAQDRASDNARLKHTVSALQEEAFTLKTDLLKHANCGFEPIEDYLQRSAKALAKAGLEERRKSMAKSESGRSMTQTFVPENSLSRFSIESQENAAQVSRPASQCSCQTQQSIASFSEPSCENDTTSSSISSAVLSPPMTKHSGDIDSSGFNPVSFKNGNKPQNSNIGGVERNSPGFLDRNQWAAV